MDSRCACSSTSVRAEIVDNAWVVPQEPVRPGGSLEPVSCSAHMPSKHMFGLPQQPVKPGGGHLPAYPVLFSDSQTCLAVSPGSRTFELLGRPLLWGTKQLVTYLLNWLLKSVVSFSNMPQAFCQGISCQGCSSTGPQRLQLNSLCAQPVLLHL